MMTPLTLFSLAALFAPAGADFEDYRGGKCIEAVETVKEAVSETFGDGGQLALANGGRPRRSLKDGDQLALKDCVYLQRQKWMFHPEYTKGQIMLVDPANKHTKCLDASDMQEGTFVQVWECVGNAQQTWAYDAKTKAFYLPGKIGGKIDVCLDLPGWDTTAPDSRLWVWGCNGQSSQSWVYDHTRLGLFDLYAPIVYGDSFACVRAPWDNGGNGAPLTAENCAETTSKLSDGERWMLGDDWFRGTVGPWDRQSYYGPLRLKADQSKCMDGGGMSEGESVVLWECNGEKQQNWDFDPPAFRLYLTDSDPSVCLERGDSGLSVQACNDDQPLQRWIVDRQRRTGDNFDEIRACPSCPSPSPSLIPPPSSSAGLSTGVSIV